MGRRTENQTGTVIRVVAQGWTECHFAEAVRERLVAYGRRGGDARGDSGGNRRGFGASDRCWQTLLSVDAE